MCVRRIQNKGCVFQEYKTKMSVPRIQKLFSPINVNSIGRGIDMYLFSSGHEEKLQICVVIQKI
jgi:hypothetical protein